MINKKYLTKTWMVMLLSLVLQSCSAAETFKNSNPGVMPKSLADVIRWRMTKDDSPDRVAIELSKEWQKLDAQADNYAVWIGHATYLINNGDITILADPIFSERASPVGWAGPERLIPPAMAIGDLPSIDAIVISHNHYDHLDIPSLQSLQAVNSDVSILVPKGDKALLERHGLLNVSEFSWWQSMRVKETEFTFTPVQHWSGRGITGRNTSWWGGWFMNNSDLSIYHAGDTGYSNDFIATRKRLGAPDIAFIPIGAYSPRWFMKNQHVNPMEAVQVAIDLDATRSFGMHWGTFILTDEPIKQPRSQLSKELIERNLPADFFLAPTPGEILLLKK